MKNFVSILFMLSLIIGLAEMVIAEEIPIILQCKCNAKVNRDYSFQQNRWVGPNGKPSEVFSKVDFCRDKVFANLDKDRPIIKSLTPKNKYGEESSTEFTGEVIHKSEVDSMITIKWSNDPFDNKIWISVLNLNTKKAIVSEMYNGVTSFGVNVETLDCK